ncbi:MAG TPA: NrfD/PsrC family molybdoenzyme membrane anchor subunit [Thermoleophilaceae bacterium]|jgi:formate-dependent nitrite reductase membrane component NrfD|nr:NrfD/PsrC family molybdoenzyme membrane anchor subunit [Thermoleophilaceae bacterium]
MTLFAEAQHFAGDPHWTWYILFYFFVAGLAGGAYFLATLLRHWGTPADEPMARLGIYASVPAIVICPILLTLDLNKPLRFWHMLVNTTPDGFGLNFKVWSPMSVGVWALVLVSILTVVSFLDALARDGKIRGPLAGLVAVGGTKVWNVIGAVIWLFVASYTGVLLAVSSQPVWSDTWALGGLFLASGLSGAAALLLLLSRYRREAETSNGVLEIGERLFAALELLLLAVFVLTLIGDGTLDEAFGMPWLLLWLVALAGMLPGLRGLAGGGLSVSGGGTIAAARVSAWAWAPALVLIGVLALRAAVIFSAQG